MGLRSVVNLDEKFSRFTKNWHPHIVAQVNEMHVKCVKPLGEFVWHKHDDTDEMFFVHKGHLTMQYRDFNVEIHEGELHVVPGGTEHCPLAHGECQVVLIEPAGVRNTGDAGGARTISSEPWI